MQTLFRLFTALAAIAMLLVPPVATAQEAKKAPAKADAPAKGKDLYPPAFFDFMLKQRTAQGQPDSPELRAAIRDELNTRELLVREAKKQGLDKTAKAEMDLTAQTVLVRAYRMRPRTSSPRCRKARSSRSSPSARRIPAPRRPAATSTGTRRRIS